MMNSDKYINLIAERLKTLDVEKAIIFGSYAYGTQQKNSDIDLLVVTKDDYFPQNFSEKMSVKLKIAKVVEDIREQVPIDLLVYTKPMFKKFVELDSLFAREILSHGKSII